MKNEIDHKKKKLLGQVYTPDYIVENILDMSGYYDNKILRKQVIDNSCGNGAFLTEIVKRYCTAALENGYNTCEIKKELETYIHGIEIIKSEQEKCINNLNCIIKKFNIEKINWDIICADTMTVNKYDGKMDFVLGNPPYVRVHNLGDNFNKIKSFEFSKSGMTDLYIVFFEIGLKMLNANGTLGYITPNSYFNSLAGSYMRRNLIKENLIEKIINLRHYQAFNATTYTAITILKKIKKDATIEYYEFDEKNLIPYYVDSLKPNEFYITDNFYLGNNKDLLLLSKILNNTQKCDVEVKNGYATLCDDVFINNFNFKSEFIIPVIKASTGVFKKILFPYDINGNIIPEEYLKKDDILYSYLLLNKDKLLKRSNEKDNNVYWYTFGRSQAIKDTFKDKLAINALMRNVNDIKVIKAPSGTGVYSGLYIISETIDYNKIVNAIKDEEFITYITLLGKYKSGGYYTFSSKDLKAYLNYKLAY